MSDNVATLEGYTKEITARNAHGCEFFLLVKPETHLDESFRAWDTDEQEFCQLDGWKFTIESKDSPCSGGCGKVRSILCSDSPAQWLCFDCRERERIHAENIARVFLHQLINSQPLPWHALKEQHGAT